jgi:hypothetical protein
MKSQSMGLAVITGASTGIGAIYADRPARRGCDLLLVARNQERMEGLAAKLARDTGSKVEILAADLADTNDLSRLERILKEDSRVTLHGEQRRRGRHCAITEFGRSRHEPDDRA